MKDAIVIGAGIVGATVARVLAARGLDVLTIDDSRPNGGTAPSGGHLRPGWFGDMKKADWEPALQLLADTWGLVEEPFRTEPGGGTTTVYRVDTDQVTQHPRLAVTAQEILHPTNYPIVRWHGGEERCRLLVVATGCWVADLLPDLKVRVLAKQGVSFRLRGVLTDGPLIRPWAPYKQVVAHQQGPREVWAGDGTTIYPRNWTEERTAACLERCREAVGKLPVVRTLVGYRPYCPPDRAGDPCLLRRVGRRCWVATGAGKSGTIAAGWAAGRIAGDLPS